MFRFTLRADGDLRQILTYLEDRSPGGARNVGRSIARALELIEQYPRGGKLSGEGTTRVVGAGRYPYLIYWNVLGDDLWVLHIRHAARHPWTEEGR